MHARWAELFRVLGDATRLRILSLLGVREACVCELVELLPVSQPAVSQHLRRLKQAGLVDERRQKSWTFYHLRSDMPDPIATWLRTLPADPSDVAWLQTHHVGLSCAVLESSESMATVGTRERS
ncbi:MAG: ArsR/SmtB family transcription factor [Clostridia bacterium]